MEVAFIALGSNLNDPLFQVKQALAQIEILATQEKSKIQRTSSFYQTKPLGPSHQPDFINLVIEMHTLLPPLELLRHLQAIESQQGRIRKEKWGPRIIDLDIILYANEIIRSQDLILPHPGIYTREFWLYPIFEIAPQLILPTGESLVELKNKCPHNELVQLKETV